MNEASSILEFDDVSYSYEDGTEALREVSLRFKKGSRTALLGRNGSGKTTLMYLAIGLYRPNRGRVLVDGKPLSYSASELAAVRQKVGMVFQHTDAQLFSASVEQDVSFGPFNLGWSEAKVREVTDEAIRDCGCESYRNRPTHYLSGGEKKRVAVAGVVAMKPEMILADEPSAHLDPVGTDEVFDIFSELNARGVSFLISTHDLHTVARWCEDAVVMDEGRVVAQGRVKDILSDRGMLSRVGLRSRYARSEFCGRGSDTEKGKG